MMMASDRHQSLRGDQLEREAQADIRQGKIAEAVTGSEIQPIHDIGGDE
ncbi:hypothetical protein [Natrinema sp. SYSU A 869]|nr:hypothetical protein [Natrinema sp. SYSU A 869]